MTTWSRPFLLVFFAALGAAACAPEGDVGAVAFAVPRALLDCASPPADLKARMWISGSAQPCALDVDLEAGTTSGACDATPGRERRLTIDWFVAADGGVDLLLAQARGDVDLTNTDEATADFAVKDDDVQVAGCLDMSADSFEGSPTVIIRGVAVPPCDVDASCDDPDDPASPACTNLGEVCAGADPFDPAEDP
jgi:hypothetical protein